VWSERERGVLWVEPPVIYRTQVRQQMPRTPLSGAEVSRKPGRLLAQVHLEREGAIDWLTLNRPERLDAMDVRMCDELQDYFGATATRVWASPCPRRR
jgi:hypothetical protein